MTGDTSVAWLHTPPAVDDTTLVIVSECLLPMLAWNSVPVVRAVEHKLTAVERFLLETALKLGDVTAADIDEVTSLPNDATRRIADRLCRTGALHARQDRYVVSEETARAVLARETLVEYHVGHLTLLFLPRSDDLLAFEHRQGRPEPPPIHRLHPIGSAVVPGRIRALTRHDLLSDRIRQRRAVGLPDDVVDIDRQEYDASSPSDAEDGTRIPETCPLYRCAGRLRSHGDEVTASINIYGDSSDRRVRLNLTGGENILGYWLRQADLLDQPEVARQAWIEIGAHNDRPSADPAETFTRTGGIEWSCRLGLTEARAVADKGRALSKPGCLEVIHQDADGSTRTEVLVKFQPRDTAAAVQFAVELAVHLVASASTAAKVPSLTEAAVRACRAYQLADDAVTESDLRNRLWERGHHKLIYQLRAQEDFAYA